MITDVQKIDTAATTDAGARASASASASAIPAVAFSVCAAAAPPAGARRAYPSSESPLNLDPISRLALHLREGGGPRARPAAR